MIALLIAGLVAGWFAAIALAWRMRQPQRDPTREAYIRDLRASLRLLTHMMLRLESKQRPLGSEEVLTQANSLLWKE